MLPFNTFSIHALLGVIVAAPLAVIFFLIYWKLGRGVLDLIFAGLVACCAAACTAAFLAGNVVPAGADSRAVDGAAMATLRCIRFMYVLAIVSMPLQLHFVLRYCRAPNALGRHIGWAYAAFLAAVPVAWSPLFLEARGEPLAPTGGWACAAPWQPRTGPLLVAFLAVWLAVQAYSLILLWRYSGSTRGVVPGR